MSRQNYYKERRKRSRRAIDEKFVIELVRRERKLQPELGTRKLLQLLKKDFGEAGVSIGRDGLFELLRGYNLLLRKKRKYPKTTDSRHGFGVYSNLL